MRVDHSSKMEPASGSELIITNMVSLTLLLSSVVILGALCQFLKNCCKKLVRKRQQDHDVINFTPITKRALRRCSSTSKLSRHKILLQSEIPFNTEEVPAQPELYDRALLPGGKPRSPSDPTRMIKRQQSAPLPGQRCSIIGWSSHPTITVFDLDPTLYKKEASLHKFQASIKTKCGMLDTEVYFDAGASQLKIRINRIQHLLIKDHMNTMGTYVMVKNLPNIETQRTTVHTNAIDHVFEEDFSFQVSAEDDVSSHVLVFELLHIDRLSTSYLRATARLPLFPIDLFLRRRLLIPFIETRRSLFTTLHPVYRANNTGCFLVSIQFQPVKEVVVVNPIRVCNIPAKRHGGFGQDVFVKVLLRHQGTRISKMKTQSTKLKRMPQDRNYYQAKFNEPLNLSLQSKPVEECDISISLNYYLFFKSSFIIGQVKLSVDEPDYEAIHFQNMIDSPGERISTWYEMQNFLTSSDTN